MEGGETMGDTLHKMQVKIEGDASPLKKELESSRQEVKRGVEAIQKETEKMKNPFRNLVGNKTIESVRASMSKIKASFESFSLKDKTKEFQIKAGIKIPTEEYQEITRQLEKVQSTLDRYYERRDKMSALGVNEESREWKSLAYDIQNAEAAQKRYETNMKGMETAGTDVQRPVSIPKQAVNLGKSAIGGIGNIASKGWGGMTKILGGMKSVLTSVTSTIRRTSGAFGALIQKFSSGIPIVRRFTGAVKNNGNSFGGGLKNILKYTLGIRSLFVLVNKLRSALVSGFNNLSQYSGETNNSLSMLMSSLTQLKNAFAAAFAPILNIVAPILNALIQKIVSVVNTVGQLIAALTGGSTYIKAKKLNLNYADSLDKNSKSANKANEANKKLQRTILGFDQINKLDDNTKTSTTKDTGLTGKDMFETMAVPNSAKEFAKKLKEAWKNADFTEIGAIVGRKLNAALQNIPWDEIKSTANRIAKSIATFLNGFIEATDWGLVGSTISQGLNTAFGFVNTFATNFHWTSLGQAISDGINGAVKTFDAATAGQTVSNVVKGILDAFITAVENTDWQQVGKKVQELLVNIDWNGVVSRLSEAIGAAFGGFAAFLWGLIGDAWKKVVQWWKDTAYKDGKFTISGLLNGIVDALKNIASWIKEHIFTPFINGFKKAFGIHSPSTVMSEQGGFIMSGLFKGLKDNLPNILTWVGNLPKKVKDKLGNAKDWLKDKGSQAIEGFAAGLKSIHIPLPHISVSWNSHTVGPVSFSTPSFGLNWYAKGGFPETGEMFVARENGPEMVGRMGRKNAVANNNQIIDGIRAGVYEAMVNALESFSGGDGQKTEVKVYLEGDSKKLFKVIRVEGQDYQKSTGKPVFD